MVYLQALLPAYPLHQRDVERHPEHHWHWEQSTACGHARCCQPLTAQVLLAPPDVVRLLFSSRGAGVSTGQGGGCRSAELRV